MAEPFYRSTDVRRKKTETVKNPKYVEFINEYQKLLGKEIELDHPTITKEDLKDAGKTKDQYNVLFNLVETS